jgi:hypothetical protein
MPFMDSWYIMDTGSTDGTQDVIRTTMTAFDAPGMLDTAPFVDFATTRNLALERSGTADCMYKLFIDGDWYLDGAEELRQALLGNLEAIRGLALDRGGSPCLPACAGCYEGRADLTSQQCTTADCTLSHVPCAPVLMLRLQLGKLSYFVPRIVRSDAGDEFVGVVHEVIGPPGVPRLANLHSVIIVNATSTNRGHSRARWVRDEGLLRASALAAKRLCFCRRRWKHARCVVFVHHCASDSSRGRAK